MLENDPLWYKDAIVYELHVRAFHDSSGAGTGDFRGLTQKLDFLQDLGITAIWLLPFYPSPLKDDGYDIADYTNIHPQYGNLEDFREFLEAAHQRGIRVITELVLNHTSDQHPWFQRARRAPAGSSERNFYVWSDTPEKYPDARIIFKDFEPSNWTWDPLTKQYYWHRFYAHQPDLNFDNPEVLKAVFPVVDFWFGMGVDGMRLDAVPYLYEREGTSCENLPETHSFLKALRRHVDEHYPNRMLLAEANQWPEDSVAYFGNGDESHMNFHFPLMTRLFMSIHIEDRFPITDILAQTPAVPENCQWGLFLRNHDELTLEMVTDEERDYMYRAYAQDPQARINLGIRRRLAPLLGNNRRRIELMNGLLFSLPGTPIVYYGDEIGMGDNIYLGDRNGVRTPMQWSSDRNAGFSRANPQKLYAPVIIDPEYHYEASNVESQQNNPNSLLWWMKRLIALRKQFKAFGRGSLEFLHPDNRKVLAFLRRYQDETVLVVANLSRFVQYAELDMSAFEEHVPIELFGRNPFPKIGKEPYLLTIGPHSFYWFALQAPPTQVRAEPEAALPTVSLLGDWETVFRPSQRSRLEQVLPEYLRSRRWFAGKQRIQKALAIREAFRLEYERADLPPGVAYITLVEVEYNEGGPETYVLPLTFAEGERASAILKEMQHLGVARVHGTSDGVLYDALGDSAFCSAILEAIQKGKRYSVLGGDVTATHFISLAGSVADGDLQPSISKAEQSHTSILYGNRLILKVFRRVEPGLNPELEIGRLFTNRNWANAPGVAGAIEYRYRKGPLMTLEVLQSYVPHVADAWAYTQDTLSSYFEKALASHPESAPPPVPAAPWHVLYEEPPERARETIGVYLEQAQLLGKRTAEMHLLLAGETDNMSLAPEPFTLHYQRSIYQTLRSMRGHAFHHLRRKVGQLPEAAQVLGRQVLDQEEAILKRLRSLLTTKVNAQRIRCHGDYHLRQVLYTGKDFVVIDLEGEPTRPLSERMLKRTPLRDVAGMVRSFQTAVYSLLLGEVPLRGQPMGQVRPEDVPKLEPWAQSWYVWVSAAFLRGYLQEAKQAPFLPPTPSQFNLLLETCILEKSFSELGVALSHRPSWARIPLLSILEVLNCADPSDSA
jgi:maltose alpha-D-glucosyltransferase/alpha-amylase